MTSAANETAFLLRRAEEEAVQAIRTETTPAAAAHYHLALLYSERARVALSNLPRPYASRG